MSGRFVFFRLPFAFLSLYRPWFFFSLFLFPQSLPGQIGVFLTAHTLLFVSSVMVFPQGEAKTGLVKLIEGWAVW